MREFQILIEKLINVKLNQSTFNIPLNCIFDIDLRNLIVLLYSISPSTKLHPNLKYDSQDTMIVAWANP